MAHHAYLYIGGQEQGITAARRYAQDALGIEGTDHPDVAVFAYEGLFPIDDARRVTAFASQSPVRGSEKLIVIAAGRLFEPAQNALLKTFEEPPAGTTLILIVPAAGIILPTLRSRLIELPRGKGMMPEVAAGFLAASASERAKIVAKIVARAKDGKDHEKQEARMEAVRLCQGLIAAAYDANQAEPSEELRLFLRDLDRFMPILHTSSAPLKLIFEHILIVIPERLGK